MFPQDSSLRRFVRTSLRRFTRDSRGFTAAEAALLACVLGGTCILVGAKLSQGAAAAATNVDNEIATGSPTRTGSNR